MTQRIWSGLSQGGYLNPGEWLNGAPVAGDSWFIGGAGDAPTDLGGVYQINNNPLVQLYDPTAVPDLTGDPDPSLIPVAAAIANQTIIASGGTAVVGFGMINSTLATSTTLAVTGVAVIRSFYTDTLAGTISIQPTGGAALDSHGNNGDLTIDVYPTGSVDPVAGVKRPYTPSVDNTGTIDVGAGSALDLEFEGGPVTITKTGPITVALGGHDAFINNGTIDSQGGSVLVQAGFDSNGAGFNAFLNDGVIRLDGASAASFYAEIDGTGTIDVAGTGAARASVTFYGGVTSNTVKVADADVSFQNFGVNASVNTGTFDFTGGDASLTLGVSDNISDSFEPIAGFQAGDTIVIGGLYDYSDPLNGRNGFATESWNQATQQLTIGYRTVPNPFGQVFTGTLDVLTFRGSYADANFKIDGEGTVTTLSFACFAQGTRIATPNGQAAVEALAAGDMVLTRDGSVRPVVWVGKRAVDCDRHAEPHLVRPIRIRAGAIGRGLPARDLLLSPDHALFVDGLLIPVRLLVNHRTIAAARDIREVTYFHIELPSHDVILAEGLPTESYLDTGNRSAFEGGAAVAAHPVFSAADADRAARGCAPFAVDAERVEPIWRRLAGRAAGNGQAVTPDPMLRVVQDGRLLPPASVDGEMQCFDLCGGGPVRILSRAMRPSDHRPWLDDRRMLGVHVRRVVVDGAEFAVPGGRGWWDAEPDGRWTDGNAELRLPHGAARLELTVGRLEAYPAGRPPPTPCGPRRLQREPVLGSRSKGSSLPLLT